MPSPKQPTGIRTETSRDSIVVKWYANDEIDIKGYNIYNSTTSGGGISGYVKINPSLITIPLGTEDIVENTTTTVNYAPGLKTTTTQETVNTVNIFGFTHENLLDGKEQFYVITAVNNNNEESLYSIEVFSTPLNLDVNMVHFPIRNSSDVTQSIITRILSRKPLTDVKPGSMTRDIHIDPQAAEMADLYIQIDWLDRKQSFLTLLEIDDPENTGESVPVSESNYKQQLKTAYNIESDDDVQLMIDDAFTRLAANYGVLRLGALPSTGEAVFSTTVRPTADITIPVGTTISTSSTPSSPSINFQTTVAAVMIFSSIESYFNDATQRYEITIPIQASISGEQTNVNSGTIINSTFAQLQVSNLKPTSGGLDEETNSHLSLRGMLAFTSVDSGTNDGYLKVAANTQGIEDAKVVDAGHPLMQRDYDDVRNRHVFGKVDVYFKGSRPRTVNETFGFLYKKILSNTSSIIDAASQKVMISDPNVSSLKPAFLITEIRNVTLGQSYNVLGSYTVYKNASPLDKSKYSVDLETGDIEFYDSLVAFDTITADYRYATNITNETLIISAIGGENSFIVSLPAIVELSDTLTLTRGVTSFVVVRDVDYFINKLTGVISILNSPTFLGGGLQAGDSLVISYSHVNAIVGEVVIAAATGGETSAALLNNNIMPSLVIEPDGLTINIDENDPENSSIGMSPGDIIRISFYYRDTDSVILSSQPPYSVVSVFDESNNSLVDGTNYSFNIIEDLLLEGNSVKSKRTVSLMFDPNNPSLLDGMLSRNSEIINLVNEESDFLLKKGIDIDTIVVTDITGSTTFTNGFDYEIVSPDQPTGLMSIARLPSSTILSGQDVIVSYMHGELITVVYNVNSLIETLQTNINKSKHTTADVLAKGASQIDVDLEFSIRLKKNASEPGTKNDILTALSNEFLKKKIGERVSQSDIIGVIDNVTGVDFVIVPLTKMIIVDGVHIPYEDLGNVSWSIFNVGIVTSYKTPTDSLSHSTLGSASDDSKFWRVSEDDVELELVSSASLVSGGAGRAYIDSDGSVYVSTINGDVPAGHKFTVAYNVHGEIGSNDIVIHDLEYLNLRNVVIHIV